MGILLHFSLLASFMWMVRLDLLTPTDLPLLSCNLPTGGRRSPTLPDGRLRFQFEILEPLLRPGFVHCALLDSWHHRPGGSLHRRDHPGLRW